MAVTPDGIFEWDDDKARTNEAKHGVRFEDILSVFEDPFELTGPDHSHSIDEERSITLGRTERGVIIVVVSTLRGERVRIVSARRADRTESRSYEKRAKPGP